MTDENQIAEALQFVSGVSDDAAFRRFAGIVQPDGVLALYGDDDEVRALDTYASAPVRFYGIEDDDDHVSATHVRRGEGGQRFTLVVDGREETEVFLPMSGKHNLRNALGVATVALREGLTPAQIAYGMGTFKGMKRRQEVRGEADGVLVVDDFAHHPTAVRETVAAIRERWPERRLVAVFEPRSNSSRRKVFEEAYGEAFDGAEEVFISAPPLRHNDDADNFLDAGALAEAITRRGAAAETFPNADALLGPLYDAVRPGDVVLIMSNGSFGGVHERLLAALGERHG